MDVLKQDQVVADALLRLFERAFMKAQTDEDGDLYISDGLELPIWVRVDAGERLIRMFTYVTGHAGPLEGEEANYVNLLGLLPTFSVRANEPDRLWCHYSMTFLDGVIDGHIVEAARRFAGAAAYGCQFVGLTVGQQQRQRLQ